MSPHHSHHGEPQSQEHQQGYEYGASGGGSGRGTTTQGRQSTGWQESGQRGGQQSGGGGALQQPQGGGHGQQMGAGGGQAAQHGAGAPAFQTANILSPDVRSTSVDVLNQALADAVVLEHQLKSAHWNVRGPDFYQLHELFEDVADEIEPHVDEIAERATALGGVARGTVDEAAAASTLPRMPEQCVDGQQLLEHVAQTLAAFDATLYEGMEAVEDYGDHDTVDLLNEVSRDVSKSMWFVEAHLQPTATAGGR